MNLIVDIGNSFVKLAVFQGAVLSEKKVLDKKDFQESLVEFSHSYPGIEQTIVSSVTGEALKWPEPFLASGKVLELDSKTPLPFENRYSTPNSLGNDRKALVAAAAKEYPHQNVLVIDAGTCLTFDFKNANNEYLGGGISPGLNMRYKALHTFTAKLPLLNPVDEVALVGNSTKGSLHSGVVIGMQKEIEGVIEEYDSLFGRTKIILTGGDAHFLSKRLKNGIFANSSFLLVGLNYILEFNKTQ